MQLRLVLGRATGAANPTPSRQVRSKGCSMGTDLGQESLQGVAWECEIVLLERVPKVCQADTSGYTRLNMCWGRRLPSSEKLAKP